MEWQHCVCFLPEAQMSLFSNSIFRDLTLPLPKNLCLKCFSVYKLSFKKSHKLIWKLFRGLLYFRPWNSSKSEPVYGYKCYAYKKIRCRGMSGLQKNLGSRPVHRRNTNLYPFWWLGAFLLMFCMGKLGKTSKIVYYRKLNPLNVVYC